MIQDSNKSTLTFKKKLLSRRFKYGLKTNLSYTETKNHHIHQVQHKIISGQYKLASRSCPVCTKSDFTVIAEIDRHSIPKSSVLCTYCGLMQTNPVPRDSDFKDYYENHYRYIYGKFRRSSLEDHIENFNKNLRVGRGPLIYQLVTQQLELKRARILDIGCGTGSMVKIFTDHGHDCLGIDYDNDFLEYGISIGLNLRNCSIESLIHDEPFDLIIMAQSLEHDPNPNRTLEIVSKLLKRNGHLFVTVPDVRYVTMPESRYRRIRNLFGSISFPHVFVFSLQSLMNLLGKHLFEIKTLTDHEHGNSLGDGHLAVLCSKNNNRGFDLISDYEEVKDLLFSIEKTRYFVITYWYDEFREHSYNIRLKLGLTSLSTKMFKSHPPH